MKTTATRLGPRPVAPLPNELRTALQKVQRLKYLTIVSVESPFYERSHRSRRIHNDTWAFTSSSQWQMNGRGNFLFVALPMSEYSRIPLSQHSPRNNTFITLSSLTLFFCIQPPVIRFPPPIVKSLFQCHSQRLQYACPKQTLQKGHLPSGSRCAFRVLHWQHLHCEVTDPKISGILLSVSEVERRATGDAE